MEPSSNPNEIWLAITITGAGIGIMAYVIYFGLKDITRNWKRNDYD